MLGWREGLGILAIAGLFFVAAGPVFGVIEWLRWHPEIWVTAVMVVCLFVALSWMED